MLGCRIAKKCIHGLILFGTLIFLLVLGMFLRPSSWSFAQENKTGEDLELSGSMFSFPDLVDELQDGFEYIVRSLLFGIIQKPADSTQNPNNDFLEIPRYSIEYELRADFFLDFRRIKLLAKPRLNVTWERWKEGSLSGDTETDVDFFVNEWLFSVRLPADLFASYGRENIQWGPSYLLSPSNPFFTDNGLSNPQREVPGMDFARLVWIPNSMWSVSFIANVDEGRQEFIASEFEPTYALKLDFTTYRKFASLIASYRENDRGRLGAFAGWTVSSAWLLYGEGTVSKGTNALYPIEDPRSPFGIRMSPVKEDQTSLEGILLLGASYTLEAGPTLTMEYVLNGEGYDDDEAELYFELRRRASEAFFLPDPFRTASQSILAQTLDPGLRLLRKNYLMLQYHHTQIWDELDLLFRYIYNLDDHSSQFNPIVEYEVGDHIELFFIGRKNFGSDETEFRSLVDYSLFFGAKYTF
jgi:hypothetical protein